METYLLYYLLTTNVVALILMGADKKRAISKQYRIREKTLWTAALIGGAFGATIGMYTFRHKTNKTLFRFGFPLLTCLQFFIIYFLLQKLLS